MGKTSSIVAGTGVAVGTVGTVVGGACMATGVALGTVLGAPIAPVILGVSLVVLTISGGYLLLQKILAKSKPAVVERAFSE